jgi:hypothetical protein
MLYRRRPRIKIWGKPHSERGDDDRPSLDSFEVWKLAICAGIIVVVSLRSGSAQDVASPEISGAPQPAMDWGFSVRRLIRLTGW